MTDSISLDTMDRRLLRALQHNADEPISDLGERLGLSRSACSRRIKRLQELGVIKRSVSLLAPDKLGLPLTVYVVIKTNQHNAKWSKQFQAIVEALPGVLEVHRLGGDIDYLLKAVVKDMPGYDALYQQLIKADLFDVSASFVMETLKETSELPI
jgi:Lrp/AsnC family transcriptional regulator